MHTITITMQRDRHTHSFPFSVLKQNRFNLIKDPIFIPNLTYSIESVGHKKA